MFKYNHIRQIYTQLSTFFNSPQPILKSNSLLPDYLLKSTKRDYEGGQESSQNQDKKYKFNRGVLYLMGLPIAFFINSQYEKLQCLFTKKPVFFPNKLENRIGGIQYPANSPIEDRYKYSQLISIDGYILSIFDGHGGWQVAEYAMENLHKEFEISLRLNKEKISNHDDYIQQSLNDAYNSIENDIIKMAREPYQAGFGKVASVGACALTALIHNNKLYAANAGDCKGIIVYQDPNTKVYGFKKINHMLNANSRKEQIRLRSLFKSEKDIVICRRGNKSCYVKNSLQPTRSFGDLRLKYPEFNNPQNLDPAHGFRRRILDFTGPYITHVPDQQIIDLTSNDKFLIMGSDGLWDELSKQDIVDIVKMNKGDKQRIAGAIFQSAFSHAANDAKMTEDELRNVPSGKRRKLHDDITLLVVDLENQV